MREASRGIVIHEGNILLIKRVRPGGDVYYTCPGGGIEDGELLESAVVREIEEETTVCVIPQRLVLEFNYEPYGVKQHEHVVLCRYVSGNPGPGGGAEYTDPKRDRGTYEPMWVLLAEVGDMEIRPKEVKEWLISSAV